MRFAISWVVGVLTLTACSDRLDEGHGAGGGAPTGGTSTGGSAPTGGTSTGGTSPTGGTSTGGTSTGGTATGGSAPTGGVSGSAGTGVPTGGSGGSGACVENLGCELAPPPSTGDIHQDCVNRINQFRAECACLPPLERWTAGEACADQMAEYDSTRDPHAGFRDDICNGGFGQNECPGWNSETQVIEGCLQSMWDEGPPPGGTCNNACFQMHGHFINMTDEDFSRVACGFFTTAGGEIWAVQNFAE